MAAEYGPGFLAQDRATRLFLYRGDMDAEWSAYGNPDAHAICAAFAAGINAYIALAEQDASLLPPEFAAMDISPARWQAEDVVRIRSHALCRNVESEVAPRPGRRARRTGHRSRAPLDRAAVGTAASPRA